MSTLAQALRTQSAAAPAPAAPAPTPAAAPPPAAPQATPANSALMQMGVDPALVGMLDESRARHRQLADTALGELEDINTQRRDLATTPLERPAVPDLPETPTPPPQRMPGNGMRVFGQFLPVLAMLAGAGVRRDATAVLRTGAAAMRAARANDLQELELQNTHFEQELERVASERTMMLAQYQAALSDAGLAREDRLAIINSLAAQENNIQLRTQVSMGDLEGIANNINTQVRAVEAIRNQQRADRAASETERHNRASEGARGRGGVLAGAEQRGRIVMSLPNVLAGLQILQEMEDATIPEGGTTGTNPYARNAAAAWTSGVPGIGDPIERVLTEDDPQYQRYDNAVASLEQSFIPMFAGAATTESEARRYIRANAPRIGDTWERLIDKRRNLQRLANQAAIIIDQPPPYPDAGFLDPRQAAALTPPTTTGSGADPQTVNPGDVLDGYTYIGPPDGDRGDPNNWEPVQ